MTFVYQSQYMHGLLEQARRFAATKATILLLGESGTGKELMARYLHQHSERNPHPCVTVNCAAFQENLIESELFGHEHGAFTGAVRQREGCIETAQAGTLFLDEIGELPMSVQAKLLRVLEEQEFSRVGSHVVRRVHARIIAATNRDLSQDVADGRFREDLFHRLDVLTIRIAPLREHVQDIPALATHFVTRLAANGESTVSGISAPAMKQLKEYHWPGNVRQLRNAIHRACVLADEKFIQSFELEPAPAQQLSICIPADLEVLPLRDIERHVILARLRRFDGNKTEAAAALGVTARTLRNKMAEYQQLKRAS
ncbi:MAG: sigma-54 dependent transcriptional regulator [Planctomycetaceae bacterium]